MGDVTGPAVTPYGRETVDEFRLSRAKWGLTWGKERQRLIVDTMADGNGRPFTTEEFARFNELVEACTNTWGVIGALAWVRKKFGEEAASELAALLDDIGINGAPWDDTLLDVPGYDDLEGATDAQ